MTEKTFCVYLVATGEITNGLEHYTRHDTQPPMADYETLYAVPQPAPVERKPLSDEQIDTITQRHGSGGWQTILDMRTFARAVIAADRGAA